MESIYYHYHLWPSNKKIQNMYPKHLTWWRTCWRLSPLGQSILWETWPQHEPCRCHPSSVELDQSRPPSPDDRDPLSSSWQQDPWKTHWKYVCLFVTLKNFSFYGDVTIACEGMQILTYAWHSWPLSSEGSLVCHIYCDTEHPFIMVISEDLWHSHLLPSIWHWSSIFTT